jgi:hypothetical protein
MLVSRQPQQSGGAYHVATQVRIQPLGSKSEALRTQIEQGKRKV